MTDAPPSIQTALRRLADTYKGPTYDTAVLRRAADRIDELEALTREGVSLDGPGRVGRDSPDTSKAAAALPVFGKERWQVLDALAGHPRGATARTITASLNDRAHSPNQVATRLKELRAGGLVEYVVGPNGLRVTSTDGLQSPALVQRLTPVGHAYRLAVLAEQAPGETGGKG